MKSQKLYETATHSFASSSVWTQSSYSANSKYSFETVPRKKELIKLNLPKVIVENAKNEQVSSLNSWIRQQGGVAFSKLKQKTPNFVTITLLL